MTPRSRLLLPILLLVVLAAVLLLLLGREPTGERAAPIDRAASDRASAPVLRGAPSATESAPSDAPPRAATADAIGVSSWNPADFPPLDVRVLDGETGRELDVSWDLVGEVGFWNTTVRINVHAPLGYVYWDRVAWTTGDGKAAPRFSAVVPLRREVPLWVTVRHEDGRRLQDARLWWRQGAGGQHAVPLTDEVTRVRRVPHFAGRHVWIQAKDGTARGSAAVRMPPTSSTRLEALVLLSEPEDFWLKDAEIEDHVEEDNDLPFEESLGDGEEPSDRTASLAVTVLRRDSSPAAGVAVAHRGHRVTTDAAGRAQLVELSKGSGVLKVYAPGIVPIRRRVTLRAGEAASIEVREPEGGSLDVTVVGKDGRGLPFAVIHVKQPSGVPWADVDGDVQRIDRFTDERGHRRLERLEPGPVTVRLGWGGLWRSTVVEVKEGQTATLRYVIE